MSLVANYTMPDCSAANFGDAKYFKAQQLLGEQLKNNE